MPVVPPGRPGPSRRPAHLEPALADGLRRAAVQFATPLYVLDRTALEAAADELADAFADPWLRHYRLAANPLPPIVRLFAERGFGASVGSAAEWRAARAAGLANDQIVLSGRGKDDADLDLAARAAAEGAPLRWVAIESAAEAEALQAIASRHLSGGSTGRGSGRRVDAILRLRSPGTEDPSVQILSAASTGGAVRWRGFALPNGQPMQTVDPWRDLARRSLALLALLRGTVDTVDTLDLAGGFPVSADDEPAPAAARFAAEVEPLLDGLPSDRRPARLAVELDSVAVARGGWLVSRVLHVDERVLPPAEPEPPPAQAAAAGATRHRRRTALRVVGADERTAGARIERLIGIDAGIPELPTASSAGERHVVAALTSLGRPIEGSGRFDGLGRSAATVLGWTDAAADSLGEHVLPPLRRGDLLAVGPAGAYASAMWSSLGGRPRPAEAILERDGRITVERPRGRTRPVR